ncbi:MAG: glycoside-pentoside-hexuronide (GPH):cation symporter [Oscillospiraceae bacterium]|nr:glycoside-pentoside-hexuronide (GPH):cation symporter [Oscillospiraceae bacterium]
MAVVKEKLSAKNYAGYGMCDFANGLAFCVMSSYLSVYCSDILGISGACITAIMLAARIWDGINDPIMGFLVQGKRPGKNGKYRPFILWGGIPLAVVSVLVFLNPGGGLAFRTVWVAAMYICYGMLYTVVLVPYGSLASVMTTDQSERSILSMCRSVGGGIGNLPTLIFPVLVMTAGADGNQMDAHRLLIAMVIIAAAMIVFYFLGFKLTTERVVVAEEREKVSVRTTIRGVLKNRAFVSMSLIGCLLIAAQMYTSTVNLYLFKDYFQNSSMNTVYMIITYLPMVLMIPFANRIIKGIGKKEFSLVCLGVSVVASFLTYVLHLGADNVYGFIILALFINAGVGFMTLEVWSMAADIIDHNEWKTGRREEAADYAIFTFMRKIGQAIAALAPWFVSLAGYDSSLAGSGVSQGESVLSGMYNVATLVPFIMYLIMFVLMIVYPLNKRTTEQMHRELAQRRAAYTTEKI